MTNALHAQREYRSAIHAKRKRYLRDNVVMCQHCGTARATEVDHVIPLALGGTSEDGWLAACAPCNRSRGAKLGARIRAEKARLKSRADEPGGRGSTRVVDTEWNHGRGTTPSPPVIECPVYLSENVMGDSSAVVADGGGSLRPHSRIPQQAQNPDPVGRYGRSWVARPEARYSGREVRPGLLGN